MSSVSLGPSGELRAVVRDSGRGMLVFDLWLLDLPTVRRGEIWGGGSLQEI